MTTQRDRPDLAHRLRIDLSLMREYVLPGKNSTIIPMTERNVTEEDIGTLIHVHTEEIKSYAGYLFDVRRSFIELTVEEPRERRRPSLWKRWAGSSAIRVYTDEIIFYKLPLHYSDLEKEL